MCINGLRGWLVASIRYQWLRQQTRTRVDSGRTQNFEMKFSATVTMSAVCGRMFSIDGFIALPTLVGIHLVGQTGVQWVL
jgi:hypothetical protein